ncbi:hypothetical protein HK101_009024 [Irineochytrium annulatum]|nr:hypothetical protein HK101_009024 [Irineochytrium annulatum]
MFKTIVEKKGRVHADDSHTDSSSSVTGHFGTTLTVSQDLESRQTLHKRNRRGSLSIASTLSLPVVPDVAKAGVSMGIHSGLGKMVMMMGGSGATGSEGKDAEEDATEAVAFDETSPVLDITKVDPYLIEIARSEFQAKQFIWYTSPLEYRELYAVAVPQIAIFRRQVITGWNKPARSLRETQLLLASVRQQCSLFNARFRLPDSDPAGGVDGDALPREHTIMTHDTIVAGLHEQFNDLMPESTPSHVVGSIVKLRTAARTAPSSADSGTTQADATISDVGRKLLPGMPRESNAAEHAPQPTGGLQRNGALPSITEDTSLRHGLDFGAPPPISVPTSQPLVMPLPSLQQRAAATTSTKYVTAHEVGMTLLDEACLKRSPDELGLIVALIHAALPLLAAYVDWAIGKGPEPFTTGTKMQIAVEILVHTLSIVPNGYIMQAFSAFLFCAITDFERREYLQRRLYAMLNDGSVRLLTKDNVGDDGPNLAELESSPVVKLSMKNRQNLQSWWFLRVCIEDWGFHYHLRILFYTGLTLGYIAALTVAVSAATLISGSLSTYLTMVALLHICSFGFLIGFIVDYDTERRVLEKRLQAIRATISSQTPPSITTMQEHITLQRRVTSYQAQVTELAELIKLLEAIQDGVVEGNKIRTIRIMGFEAGENLFNTLFTIIALAVSVLLKQWL